MRRWLPAGLLALVMIAAPDAQAQTSPALGRDVLTARGTTLVPNSGSATRTFDIHATSGPSGEAPQGSGRVDAFSFTVANGPVLCIAVSGNRAVVGIGADPNSPGIFEQSEFVLVDGGPGGANDRFFQSFLGFRESPDCVSTHVDDGPGTLTSGDITIRDAQPRPTSKEQCMKDGWRRFGRFKNQGDCVSFVATGGRNGPSVGGR